MKSGDTLEIVCLHEFGFSVAPQASYQHNRSALPRNVPTNCGSRVKDRDIVVGEASYDIVPLGTGGTFAEAVLGRSNSAEKLDITRFWDWQDSPIPLQPTEIAAIPTGSRASAEDTKPGQLSNPIINIMPPTALPDPVGTAAVLQAIQNGNMFRDMSGLAGTIGLAQANLQATSAGAASAAQQAGENMNNLLKANTERQRIAAEMITSLARTAASAYTGGAIPAGGGISGGGSSQQGAKINYFDKTEGEAGAVAGQGGQTNQPFPLGSSSRQEPALDGNAAPTTASQDSDTPRSAGTNLGYSDSYSRNPAALAATWGDGQPRSELVHNLLDWADSSDGGGDTSAPPESQGQPPRAGGGWKSVGGGYKERYWPIVAIRPGFPPVLCNYVVQRPAGTMSDTTADAIMESASKQALDIAKPQADANPGMSPCYYVGEALKGIFKADQMGFRLILGAK